jgi:hypothetical protein
MKLYVLVHLYLNTISLVFLGVLDLLDSLVFDLLLPVEPLLLLPDSLLLPHYLQLHIHYLVADLGLAPVYLFLSMLVSAHQLFDGTNLCVDFQFITHTLVEEHLVFTVLTLYSQVPVEIVF